MTIEQIKQLENHFRSKFNANERKVLLTILQVLRAEDLQKERLQRYESLIMTDEQVEEFYKSIT